MLETRLARGKGWNNTCIIAVVWGFASAWWPCSKFFYIWNNFVPVLQGDETLIGKARVREDIMIRARDCQPSWIEQMEPNIYARKQSLLRNQFNPITWILLMIVRNWGPLRWISVSLFVNGWHIVCFAVEISSRCRAPWMDRTLGTYPRKTFGWPRVYSLAISIILPRFPSPTYRPLVSPERNLLLSILLFTMPAARTKKSKRSNDSTGEIIKLLCQPNTLTPNCLQAMSFFCLHSFLSPQTHQRSHSQIWLRSLLRIHLLRSWTPLHPNLSFSHLPMIAYLPVVKLIQRRNLKITSHVLLTLSFSFVLLSLRANTYRQRLKPTILPCPR